MQLVGAMTDKTWKNGYSARKTADRANIAQRKMWVTVIKDACFVSQSPANTEVSEAFGGSFAKASMFLFA